jgi:hypothetical protein
MRWWPFGRRETAPQAGDTAPGMSDRDDVSVAAERPHSADVPVTAEEPARPRR